VGVGFEGKRLGLLLVNERGREQIFLFRDNQLHYRRGLEAAFRFPCYGLVVDRVLYVNRVLDLN
jgi:hypothetical protein